MNRKNRMTRRMLDEEKESDDEADADEAEESDDETGR